ncbi:unnamed protein product [Litomosoides sigmodontis]|uniref:Chitin-binding type-2 domain-containing protein n=1 Tax=Litomosoides sigmodontis TaxID=42156 RepID=A0A3P6V8P2_LITSI|nr:unnamed protein product [Litomosoides sigmodontis]
MKEQYDYANEPERLAIEELCNGHLSISLGACSNAYVRCSYNSTGHYQMAILEECPIGKEMKFCSDRNPGIYMFPKIICSRQAYVCKNYNEGFGITCLPGMVMLRRPFGCFAFPPTCAPSKISLKQFAPLRQYAIEMYCKQRSTATAATRNFEIAMLPQVQCITWYVGCGKLIKDIIYCENGFIYDAKLGRCRQRNVDDRCVMPDLCKNRKWRMLSFDRCNRQFIYCRGEVPEEFVCSEGFIFLNGRCIPIYQASGQCWKCQHGQKRQTSLHACNEYSICKRGRWEDHRCPAGMVYSNAKQSCRTDPSCAHPFECKMGQSFQLNCNEYLICSSKGIVEHRFCPPFHRWDGQAQLCIADSNCLLPSSATSCKEGTVIDSFDCKFYHQCSAGKWYKMSCATYPAVELCKACRHSTSVSTSGRVEAERCNDGDTIGNPQNCRNYGMCDGGRWKYRECKAGTYWNERLKRCYHTTDCQGFKRVECKHGQYLIGGKCNEYLKCQQGSWRIMKCIPGYALDVTTKKCVISDECAPSDNNYLSLVDNSITAPLPSFFQLEGKFQGNKQTQQSQQPQQQQQQQQHRPCQFGSAIRNEYDCNRYFECATDEYRDRYCKDNYEFNDESGQCEKEYRCDLSRCRNGRTIESEICGHYQTCINGTWHKRVCEDNRRFADGSCQIKTFCNDDSDAISSILSSSSCNEGSVLADDIDCKRYFICRQGRFQEQFCWNGASFDKARGYCVRDTTACTLEERCIGNNVEVDKQDRTAYRICNNGKFQLHFCPYGLAYSSSSGRCEKDSAVADDRRFEICTESASAIGYRADPNNCRKFYQCTHGKWIARVCPAKSYWNAEKTACDWSRNDELCKNYNNIRVSLI